MKFLKKVIKIIFDIIIFLGIILCFVIGNNFFQIRILNKEYANIFGYTIFEIATGSMEESIKIDDGIIVKITQDVKKDDIITFEVEGQIVTHRIIEETEDSLTTKGDANNAPDDPITKENVIGKVIKIIPKMGVWKKVLTDAKVLLCIFITLTLIGLVASEKKPEEKKKKRHSFSRFMRNVRGIRKNGKGEETKE